MEKNPRGGYCGINDQGEWVIIGEAIPLKNGCGFYIDITETDRKDPFDLNEPPRRKSQKNLKE